MYLCSTNQLSMKIGYAKKVVLHNVWVFVMSAQQIWITLLLQFECHLKWHDKESFTHLFQLLYFEKHLKKKELLRVSLYFQSSPSDENYFMFVAYAIYVLFACPFLIDCCTWLNYLQTKFSECDVSRRISPLRMLCTNTKLSMNDPWYKEWFSETRLSNLNARIPRISTTRRLFRKYTGYISWEFPRTPIGRLIVLR